MQLLKSNKKDHFFNIFIFIVLLCAISFWFYNCASLLFNAYNNICISGADDVRDYNQAAWNTAHGRLFQYTNADSEEIILAHKNKSALNAHSHIIFLLIALSYLIMPHFSSFVILQSLFIAMSGIALYLVAKEMLTEKKIFPLLIVFIYLQYFPLACVSRFVRPDEFSIFFIFFAVYFYLKDRPKLTLIFFMLAIFCREEICLVVGALGLISYFDPTKRKYFLPFTLAGFLSFLIIRYAIVRTYPATEGLIDGHYGYLGKTYLSKLTNIILHPSLVINNILRADRATLFKDIFAPVLYLPFLAPMLFIPGLVILFEAMLSKSWSMGTLQWQPWYLCPLIPFVFIALIGTFEKIYQLDKLMQKIFKKHDFYNKKNFCRLNKVISIILISFLLVYIYMRNFNPTKFSNNQFQDYFSINRYWYADTFGVLSAIKKDAKVACSYKLMPMLSSREYVLPMARLTKRIVNQGFYDIILISETDWDKDLSEFDFVKDADLYKKTYSTPYINVFTRKDIPPPLNNWKFDLISDLKSSSILHNYIIFNFTDYVSILENSNLLEPSDFVRNIYQNNKLYFATLEPIGKQSLSSGQSLIRFSPDKPLEENYNYILAFAAKTDKRFGTVYVKFPSDNYNKYTEIKVDDKLRIFMFPFKLTHAQQPPLFLIQMNNSYYFTKPIVLRAPLASSRGIFDEPFFWVEINKYTFSYNPWLKSDYSSIKRIERPQFLRKHTSKNPLLYFMKLLKFSIPGDLYQYSWVSNWDNSSEIIAIRY